MNNEYDEFGNSQINFERKVHVPITLGHAFFVWETLNTHFGRLDSLNLTDNEKKAIWGLTDLLEKMLIQNGIREYDYNRYKSLLKKAEQHLQNNVQVDFVE